MYSDKEIVNTITALLLSKGVTHAVLCPGSRNIPIVANLCEADAIRCHAVTDERSAGFYALGLALATGEPVVVCVTSGSALLNVAPAVCEAYYRHVPLIVVSADRPKHWIDRNDGQTIRQAGALANFIKAQADVEEIADTDTVRQNMQQLILNKTLNEAMMGDKGPVHINVHIDDPLFSFSTSQLPAVKNITAIQSTDALPAEAAEVIDRFMASVRKMIVIGQLPRHDRRTDALVRELRRHFVVVSECLSSAVGLPADRIVTSFMHDDKDTAIDFVISLGGNFIGKNIKRFLRSRHVTEHWEVNCSGLIHDTFLSQTGIIQTDPIAFLTALCERAKPTSVSETNNENAADAQRFLNSWNDAVRLTQQAIDEYDPKFSQLSAIREMEMSLEDMDYDFHVHYANSMAVRVGSLYASHYVWCNRGVNGIEGSLSMAAGFSLATTDRVFCVIGDLSFFYDQNALWNAELKGNFRILLINNSAGGIFSQLNGLNLSAETMRFVAGEHKTNARGICEQNDIGYLSAHNQQELQQNMAFFLTEETTRPMLLEVFTTADDDKREFEALVKLQKSMRR